MNDQADEPAADEEGRGTKTIELKCLAGAELPAELRREAQRITKLPEGVLGELRPIIQSCVLQPMTPGVGDQLSRFCVAHEVAEADLGGVLKVCGWLLREASALDLSTQALGDDVRAVFGGAGDLAAILESEYGPFKQAVREELLTDALLKHGNVLSDVDWRVDTIVSERQAPKLATPVALVTLAYRDAQGSGRLTLQITPSHLARLAQIFGALAQRTQLTAEGLRGGAQ